MCENHYQGFFVLNLEYWVVISRDVQCARVGHVLLGLLDETFEINS